MRISTLCNICYIVVSRELLLYVFLQKLLHCLNKFKNRHRAVCRCRFVSDSWASCLLLVTSASDLLVHTIRFCSFCCLQRNVKPCCRTYDLSWLCIMRERAASLSRRRTTETVTLSRVALGGRIPAVYDQRYNCHNLRDGGRRPPATMFTTPRPLQRQQQAYRLRIAISAYPTSIRRHRWGGGVPVGISPSRLIWKN